MLAVLVVVNQNRVAGAVFPLPVDELTVRVRGCVAVFLGDDESVASTVMLNCPVCDVVPASTPLLCRLMPEGKVPDVRDQV